MIIITGSIKDQMICLFDVVNDRLRPTVGLMMYRCETGPTLNQHCADVSCYLERAFNQIIHLRMMCTTQTILYAFCMWVTIIREHERRIKLLSGILKFC